MDSKREIDPAGALHKCHIFLNYLELRYLNDGNLDGSARGLTEALIESAWNALAASAMVRWLRRLSFSPNRRVSWFESSKASSQSKGYAHFISLPLLEKQVRADRIGDSTGPERRLRA